ncbi:MAG: GreA/GreB family elongation factor [Weeksellaceae bacterium]
MSRGFVKEGDQEEAVIIPPRAVLPPGTINYVTPVGLEALKNEKESLLEERRKLSQDNENEYRRATTLIDGKIYLLEERLASARLIIGKEQPEDEVRFGARVKIKKGKHLQEFRIVGVDEADVKMKKISFTSPLARAITGKKLNEILEFKLGNHIEEIQILEIDYSY